MTGMTKVVDKPKLTTLLNNHHMDTTETARMFRESTEVAYIYIRQPKSS